MDGGGVDGEVVVMVFVCFVCGAAAAHARAPTARSVFGMVCSMACRLFLPTTPRGRTRSIAVLSSSTGRAAPPMTTVPLGSGGSAAGGSGGGATATAAPPGSISAPQGLLLLMGCRCEQKHRETLQCAAVCCALRAARLGAAAVSKQSSPPYRPRGSKISAVAFYTMSCPHAHG